MSARSLTLARSSTSEPGERHHHARTTTYILDVAYILLLLVHLAPGLLSQTYTVSFNRSSISKWVVCLTYT
jgi:hypothetical protein